MTSGDDDRRWAELMATFAKLHGKSSSRVPSKSTAELLSNWKPSPFDSNFSKASVALPWRRHWPSSPYQNQLRSSSLRNRSGWLLGTPRVLCISDASTCEGSRHVILAFSGDRLLIPPTPTTMQHQFHCFRSWKDREPTGINPPRRNPFLDWLII